MFKNIDQSLFWPSLISTVGVAILIALFPESSAAVIKTILKITTVKFGWLFLWGAFLTLIFVIWLGCSKYGNIKFGGPDDKPEYSTFSWIAMMFCSGIGSGMLYWGTIEWSYFINKRPLGFEPFSKEAFEISNAITLLHWGPTAWAMYCLPTLAICYAFYVKKTPVFRTNVTCKGVLGDHADGKIGTILENFVVFGIIAGHIPSLGLGAGMVCEAVSSLTGIPHTFRMELIVIVCWVIIFGTSVYMGLEKGIKRLSSLNVYFALAVVFFVFLVGPTLFICNAFTNAVGQLFQNYFALSLFTDWYGDGGFPQNWTAFYWAWWLVCGPMVGLFAARISKGRTLRGVVMAMLIGGTAGTWLFHGVLGNYAMYLHVNEILDVVKLTTEQSGAIASIKVLSTLPMSKIVLVFFILTAFIFQSTSLDSTAYSIAMVCEKNMANRKDPSSPHRVFWAIAFATLPIALLFLGGLKTLKSTVFITAIPLFFIFIIMAISLLKDLKADYSTIMDEQENSQHGVPHDITLDGEPDDITPAITCLNP